MAGESSVEMNEGSGDIFAATYQDAANRQHQKVVIQTQTGAGDPANVGASNPLPVSGSLTILSGSVSLSGVSPISGTVTAVGDIANATVDSGNPIKIAGVYNSAAPTFTSGQRANVQLDINGNLKVNIAAGAAAGGTSSSFGAATPAVGTAAGFSDGTNMQGARVFDADTGGGVEYVQGVVLRRSGSGGSIEVGTASNPLIMSGAVAAGVAASGNPVPMAGLMLSAAPTYTNGQSGAIQVDASGNLKVNIQSGGGSGGTASNFAAALPAAGTAVGFSDGTNMQAARVFDLDTGGGTIYGVAVSIRLAGSGSTTEGGSTSAPLAMQGNVASAAADSGNPVKVGGVFLSAAPTLANGNRGDLQLDVNGNLKVNLTSGGVAGFQDNTAYTAGTSQGLVLMGYLDDAASSVLTENNAGAVRMTANRALHVAARDSAGVDATDTTVAAIKSVNTASATGGSTGTLQHISAASTSAVSVKGSAGTLHWIHLSNAGAGWAYFKIFNKATAPTVGSDTPVGTFGIPPGGGFNLPLGAYGQRFATGIAYSITGAPAVADTTALALNQVTVAGGFV